jgi:bile acid:Na+ symporter, BASS family
MEMRMETLQTLVPMALTMSLAGLVVAAGLDADLDDLLYMFRRPLQLAKAVLAVNVIVPVAAVLLVFVFPLSPIARAGVLLMAVSPVPPLAPGKELKFGVAKSYAYGLYIALALLSVAVVPIAVQIMASVYDVNVSLPLGMVARNVALTVVAPIAVGMLVRRLAPRFAQAILPAVKTAATVLLLFALGPLLVTVWPALTRLVGNGTLLAMALTLAIALAAGHLLGGPDLRERGALAVTAATRHPGIALMIATHNNADKAVTAAIVGMLLVGLVVATPYQIWLKRRAERTEAAPSPRGLGPGARA